MPSAISKRDEPAERSSSPCEAWSVGPGRRAGRRDPGESNATSTGSWVRRGVTMWLTSSQQEAAVVASLADPALVNAPGGPPTTRGPGRGFSGRVRAFIARRRSRPAEVSPSPQPYRRSEDALAVLQQSRVVLQRGWVQDAWYVVCDTRGNLRMFGPVQPQRLEATRLVKACLVGAVLHSSWQWSPDETSSGPAIDALWETLQETRGLGPQGAVGRVCAPMVRAARVRDLVRWNDRVGQTQEDVLALVDRTIARMVDTANDHPDRALTGGATNLNDQRGVGSWR
jgi:hypothetical protein